MHAKGPQIQTLILQLRDPRKQENGELGKPASIINTFLSLLLQRVAFCLALILLKVQRHSLWQQVDVAVFLVLSLLPPTITPTLLEVFFFFFNRLSRLL